MGDLKRAMEGAGGAMYGFKIDPDKPLAEEAARAVSRIYSAGISIRNDIVSPGTNNVMASLAAAAFTAGHLAQLRSMNEGTAEAFADIIETRQVYTEAADNAHTTESQALLQQIYDDVKVLKVMGWQPESEPTEFDAAGRIVRKDAPGPEGPSFF